MTEQSERVGLLHGVPPCGTSVAVSSPRGTPASAPWASTSPWGSARHGWSRSPASIWLLDLDDSGSLNR